MMANETRNETRHETRTKETRLTAHCRLEQLAAIATAARQMAEPAVGPEAAALVDLAITEICSNVVRHGHPREPEHTYDVVVKTLADAVEIEVRDVGPPFAMHAPEMPSVDVDLMNLPEGGFGVALVAGTIDEFAQWREGDVNITRMLKRRS
jgi:serine/threonine-protein kinase RsbW